MFTLQVTMAGLVKMYNDLMEKAGKYWQSKNLSFILNVRELFFAVKLIVGEFFFSVILNICKIN